MDGYDSSCFHYFRSLVLRGFLEVKKHVDSFIKIIEITYKLTKMPCFPENCDINKILMNLKEGLIFIKMINRVLNWWRI